MTTSFAPTVLTRDGRTITPTGVEWLLAFALRGCEWAIRDLEKIDPFLYKAQCVERQLFSWESWDGDQQCMQFYDVELKIRIGDHQPGSKFELAAIEFETGKLHLYPEAEHEKRFTFDLELKVK